MLEVSHRRTAQPAPNWAVWEALSDPSADQRRRSWMQLRKGEVPPNVVEAQRPKLVVWGSLWAGQRDLRIRFDIAGDGRPGCWLMWTLLSPTRLEDEDANRLRYRLNELINADLRYSFGQ